MTEINNIIEENKENEEVKLIGYQKTKLWRKNNPILYAEQNRRKYLKRKENGYFNKNTSKEESL